MTVRTLAQRLHLRSAKVKELLGVLATAGQVRATTYKATNGKRTEIWTTTA